MDSTTKSSPEERRGKGRPRCFDHDQALQQALKIFWANGYAPTSIAELCKAMKINPPSLYADFGNKAKLFIEAVNYYERTYWQAPAERFWAEPDIYRAIEEYFETAASILLSPNTPCGCMVVLAAINISDAETQVIGAISQLRTATKKMFIDRLQKAIADGQIPSDTDVPSLANALNTFLEGLSIQARDGLSPSELRTIAKLAVRLLPPL